MRRWFANRLVAALIPATMPVRNGGGGNRANRRLLARELRRHLGRQLRGLAA